MFAVFFINLKPKGKNHNKSSQKSEITKAYSVYCTGGANKKSSLSHLVEKLCSSLPGLSPSEARHYIVLFKEQRGVRSTAT